MTACGCNKNPSNNPDQSVQIVYSAIPTLTSPVGPQFRPLHPIVNQSLPSVAVKEWKVCDNAVLHLVSLWRQCSIYTFTLWCLNIYISTMTWECLHCTAQSSGGGNTKTGKTVNITNGSGLTLDACDGWGWFGLGVGFTGSALPAFVGLCLGWCNQGCSCAWPLLYTSVLKDQRLLCISMSANV